MMSKYVQVIGCAHLDTWTWGEQCQATLRHVMPCVEIGFL